MLGPNFLGNHSVHPDPGIRLPDISFVPGMDVALAEGRATDASRGFHSARWPIERILARGYAVATFYYGDLFPDRADGRALSIQPHLRQRAGAPALCWGAIATWSWAMSRALDALESMPDIDAAPRRARSAIRGMARRRSGPARLDPRFALVIANNSGKGGASLMRRNFGETIRHLDDPLSALVRRGLCAICRTGSGAAGRPAHAHRAASRRGRSISRRPRTIFGPIRRASSWARSTQVPSIACSAPTDWRRTRCRAIDQPVMGTIGYHIRSGGHGVTAWDWERFLDFADRHMPS